MLDIPVHHDGAVGLLIATRPVTGNDTPHNAAWALLRQTLSDAEPDRAPDTWRFVKDDQGKPSVLDAPLHISLSHTVGLVAAAVSRHGPVGIDVESAARRIKNPLALARRFFTADECAALAAIADVEARRTHFLRLWTVKEAVVKALGTGIADTFTVFSINIDQSITLTTGSPGIPETSRWHIRQEPAHGHWLALAVILT